MQRAGVYKAAGMFLMIVGSMVMGMAAGMGLVAWMVKQRLTCVTLAGAESNACQDIVGAAMDMIMASAGGGFIAFIMGLLAVMLVIREEQEEVNND